jgi:DNA-binding CsgD family transcriptional regulator
MRDRRAGMGKCTSRFAVDSLVHARVLDFLPASRAYSKPVGQSRAPGSAGNGSWILGETADVSLGMRVTPRETQVLVWVAAGKSDWAIGRILNISNKTVNFHVENAKRKFGVGTRLQAVVAAMRNGIIR